MDTPPEPRQRKLFKSVAQMRAVGLGLGMLPLLAVMHELDAPWIMWALALANGLAWPWVAHRLSLQNADPLKIERRNLAVDSFMGGVWVALMQFNVVPSVVLGSLLLMDKLVFGGLRLGLPCFGLFSLAALGIGALNGFAFQPESSMTVVLATLPLLIAYPAAIALAAHSLSQRVRRQSEALEQLSRTDPLTGLSNRRALMEATEHEFRRFRRSGYRASFMMIDVDRFKGLNDTFGHGAGDEALKAIGDVLKRTLRDTDTCGRLGGDEFGAVLTDATGGSVGDLAERLRQAMAALGLTGRGGLAVTVSIGYAQVDSSMDTREDWIAAADAALYAAKQGGRNRSHSAPAFGALKP